MKKLNCEDWKIELVGNRESEKLDRGDYEYIYIPLRPVDAANLGVDDILLYPCLRIEKPKEK